MLRYVLMVVATVNSNYNELHLVAHRKKMVRYR